MSLDDAMMQKPCFDPPVEHNLKCWPVFFEAIRLGDKKFEFRKNDRRFMVGHTLLLREWEPDEALYTGRWIRAKVTYMLSGKSALVHGIDPDYCVMSIDVVASDAD